MNISKNHGGLFEPLFVHEYRYVSMCALTFQCGFCMVTFLLFKLFTMKGPHEQEHFLNIAEVNFVYFMLLGEGWGGGGGG